MNLRKFLSIILNKPEHLITEQDLSRLDTAMDSLEGLHFGDTSDLAMRLCAASIALNDVTVKMEVLDRIKCDIYNDTEQLSLI